MNKVASINKQNNKFIVTAIDEFESINYIDDMKTIMKVDYLIVVDDKVQIGDTYDPETENFINPEGNIVFCSMTDTKRIENLERKLNEEINKNNKSDNKTPDINNLSREEQYHYVIQQIKSDCERVILAGFDAFYPMDVKATPEERNSPEFWTNRPKRHYSLSLTKQEDLKETLAFIRMQNKEDRTTVLWRDDSLVMKEEYTVDSFVLLYNFLTGMITACKCKSDGLEQLVTNLYNAGENFLKVNWNTKLPEDIKNTVCNQINTITKSMKGENYLSHVSKIHYKDNTIEFC